MLFYVNRCLVCPGDGGDENRFILKGQGPRGKVEQRKLQPSAREVAMNYAQRVRKPVQQAKPKVRNYNVRDDGSENR